MQLNAGSGVLCCDCQEHGTVCASLIQFAHQHTSTHKHMSPLSHTYAGVYLGTENFFYNAQRLGMRLGPLDPTTTSTTSPPSLSTTASGGSSAPSAHASQQHQHQHARLQRGQPTSPDHTHRHHSSATHRKEATPAPTHLHGSDNMQHDGLSSLAELAAAGSAFCSRGWPSLRHELVERRGMKKVAFACICCCGCVAMVFVTSYHNGKPLLPLSMVHTMCTMLTLMREFVFRIPSPWFIL